MKILSHIPKKLFFLTTFATLFPLVGLVASSNESQDLSPKSKGNRLNVQVLGSVKPDLTTYTCDFIYVKEGKEIQGKIDGSLPNRAASFFGDYVKSCTVRKTSEKGWLYLMIAENADNVFLSGRVTNNREIVYKRGITPSRVGTQKGQSVIRLDSSPSSQGN